MKLEKKYLAILKSTKYLNDFDITKLNSCFELLALATAINKECSSRLSPYKLSEGKFVLLVLLKDAERLSPHELADRAGVTRATITGFLDGLENDGYVIRKHDDKDRRKITLYLTSKGNKLVDSLFLEHIQWIRTLLEDLNDKELKLLSNLLTRIWKKTN